MRSRTLSLIPAALGVALLAGCGDASDPLAPTAPEPQFHYDNPRSVPPNANSGFYHVAGFARVDDSFRPTVKASYAFTVREDRDGTTGHFVYMTTLLSGPLFAEGRVVCLHIDGNKGRVGGIVTRSNRPEIPAGHEFVWSFTDNGSRHDTPDMASSMLGLDVPGFAQAYCTGGLPYPENEVQGQIVVVPIKR